MHCFVVSGGQFGNAVLGLVVEVIVMRQLEHNSQVALFQWAAIESERRPELKMMFAIPNGGKRSIGVAKKMKAEGVKRGVPDIFLAVTTPQHYGLFIEMKAEKGKLSIEQKEWLKYLTQQDYKVAVCYSFDDAKKEIESYLKQKVN